MSERKSTLKAEVLAKYPNEVFIETGTYDGSGAIVAVEVGFSAVFTIEISPRLYSFSRARFIELGYTSEVASRTDRIFPYLGDAVTVLPLLTAGLMHRCTFWLDAHQPQDGMISNACSSIIADLSAIKASPLNTHTILIDDMDWLGTGHMNDLTLAQLQTQLRQINPNYRFFFEHGNKPNSILVATL